MDRAGLVRETWRRVLLGALLIQVLTPDQLDLSLLSQSLPPGPIFVVSSLSASSARSRAAGERTAPDSAAIECRSSTVGRDDGDQDGLCEPFWPELGLPRYPNARPDQWPRPGPGRATTPFGQPCLSSLSGIGPLAARAAPQPCLSCRLTC